MKYLNFYEELNYETYTSAYQGLKNKGYDDRAERLREKTIDEFFTELFQDMETFENPLAILFSKHRQQYMILEKKKRKTFTSDNEIFALWCDPILIWRILEEMDLEYEEIQKIIKSKVIDFFDIDIDFEPLIDF